MGTLRQGIEGVGVEGEAVRPTDRVSQLIAEADADVTAGRVVESDAVKRWIDSLGTDCLLPVPRSGR